MLKIILASFCFSTFLLANAMADTPPYYLKASDKLVAAAHEALQENDLFRALVTFEKAIVSNPKNINAYRGLGQAHMALENFDLALKYLDTGLLMEPSSLPLLQYRGLTLIRLNDESEAKEVLDKMRFICEDKPCPLGDVLEEELTSALQKKVAAITPE